MASVHSRYVMVDGIRTHYLEGGDGPAVVFLHSGEFGGCAELSWEYNIEAFAQHFHVIAPDWLGFGRTDAIRREGIAYLKRNHVAIYGTPDQVVEQVKELYGKIGGFGHFLAMMHSGSMSFENTAKSMTLFAKEVLPQIKDLGTTGTAGKPLAKKRARKKATAA